MWPSFVFLCKKILFEKENSKDFSVYCLARKNLHKLEQCDEKKEFLQQKGIKACFIIALEKNLALCKHNVYLSACRKEACVRDSVPL